MTKHILQRVLQLLQRVLQLLQRVLQLLQRTEWLFGGLGLIFLGLFCFCQWGSGQWIRTELELPTPHLYGDWEEKPPGHSSAHTQNTNNHWTLVYQLQSGFVHPYVGLSFRFDDVFQKGDSCLDLSKTDSLILELQGQKATGLTLELVDQLPHKMGDEPFRILQSTLPLSNQRTAISINQVDLTIPEWWRQMHHVPLGSQSRHLNRVCRIDLVAGDYVPLQTVDQIHLYSIHLIRRNYWGLYLSLGGFFLCLGAGFFGGLISRQRKRWEREKELIRHKPLDLEPNSNSHSEWERIQHWILNEYENPDCSLDLAAQFLNISKRKISETLKEKTGLGFREYLNKIRLREACEQLAKSDLPIQTIAFAIGFGNVSHFNRVFKEEWSCTPKEWRQRH